MKRTDRELDNIIDDTAGEIRHENLDPAIVAGASHRVWSRLAGEQAETGPAQVEQIRGCGDFQALIPAYMQGVLSSARTILLEDHVRECVPCRRALKEARNGNKTAQELETQKAYAAKSSSRMAYVRWAVAATLILAVGLVSWPYIQRFTNSLSTLNAIVEAANGSVYKVSDNHTREVKSGEKIDRGEHIRTSKNAGAVVKLSDGSLIEMRERSEFSVNDSAEGTTINLERGNIIVQAAKQRNRKLFVATDDSLVSVTGTIFSVNSGTKGARVSVIEGEVHVGQGSKDHVLRAGQQLTTHPSIERNTVKDEIAWSRDAQRYGTILDAVRSQIDQQVPLPDNRYSTRLLDLMPENTVVYVAIPNITETLAQANRILEENLQKNAELREWWDKSRGEQKGRHDASRAINLAREFGGYLGDEIVLGAEAGAKGGEPQEPFILAVAKDPAAFRSFLETQINGLGADKKEIRIIDDPMTASVSGEKGEFYVWINNDLVAASPRLDSLKSLSARVKQGAGQGAGPFTATPFHAQIAGIYHEGAGFLIAVDLEKLFVRSLPKGEDKAAAAVEQLGVTGLRTFIVEVKEKDGKHFNRAVVSFKEGQHGVTSWLAQPGPMGALEFISPDANVVAAFVVKEPTALVDDLLNALKTADTGAWQHLQDFQATHGVNLRDDIAAPLGGEYAVAMDGPLLPTPSWKVIFQVDDQEHLQQALERAVERINDALTKEGRKGLEWAKAERGDKTFYTLKSLDLSVEVNYTYAYGYLIVAPSQALVENAIRYRESGYTLLQSAKFKATLPEDKQANFSVMVYQNLGSVLGPIAGTFGKVADGHTPRGAAAALSGLLGKKAGLAYAYALNDRMIFSINTEDGPVGLSPSDLIGIPGFTGFGGIVREATK